MHYLTPTQKYIFYFGLAFAVFFVANSAYLFTTSPHEQDNTVKEVRYQTSTYGMAGTQPIENPHFDETSGSLSKFYQSMLLYHILGGIALMALVVVFVAMHLQTILSIPNRKAKMYGGALVAILALLTFSGLFILTEANSTQNRWIFYSHRIMAVVVVLAYIGHRWVSSSAPAMRKLAVGMGVLVVVFALLMGIHSANAQKTVASTEATEEIHDPYIPFDPGNIGEKDSFFFPSPSTTTSGNPLPRRTLTREDVSNPELIEKDLEKYGFVVNDSMGSATCARCHAGIVEQWSRSTHRFSSFNNPFYKASVDRIREEENGKVRSQWCGACHDPVLMFAGKMRDDIDPLWPESQAGLTCLSCHAIDKIHGKEANGNYNISDGQPSPYLFAGHKSGLGRQLHDMVLKSKPTVHKNRMLKPFFRASEFCMTCHKVSLDTPINNYKWLRGQDDYDAWHNSGVAHNAARTFYEPPNKRSCQDCHMPMEKVAKPDVSAEDGMVKSHRFLAVNNALPYIRGDDESVEYIKEFVQGSVIVDVFAIRKLTGGGPIALEASKEFAVELGEEIQVDVVVRNFSVGHTFPGGTNDSNESWIDFQVMGPNGEPFLRSGELNEDGYVDPEAHFYNVLFVDKNSQPALNRNPQDFHVVVYSRLIETGTANAARYRFVIPQHWPYQSMKIKATLNWRKFNRHYTEFVFSHERLPNLPKFEGKEVPNLPIVKISESEVEIPIGSEKQDIKWNNPFDERPDWMRFNDYGIANLLQGDLRTADWAFEQVKKLQPKAVDGPRNLARVALQEGRLDDVYRLLGECEILEPGDPQTAWFWALAKKKEGLYGQAIYAFERVLAYYPEDRMAWKQLARTHYLNGEYKKSLKAYMKLLAIDPEESTAHYHRMLCYRALGETEKAEEAEKAYRKYQVDESAREVTQKFRLENPEINKKSQPLHVYDLTPSQTLSQK